MTWQSRTMIWQSWMVPQKVHAWPAWGREILIQISTLTPNQKKCKKKLEKRNSTERVSEDTYNKYAQEHKAPLQPHAIKLSSAGGQSLKDSMMINNQTPKKKRYKSIFLLVQMYEEKHSFSAWFEIMGGHNYPLSIQCNWGSMLKHRAEASWCKKCSWASGLNWCKLADQPNKTCLKHSDYCVRRKSGCILV